MTQVATTGFFDDWAYSSSGDGSFSKSGKKWLLQSGVNTGSSVLTKTIPARPGETITFSCLGRLWAGGYGTSGGIYIDYPSSGVNVASANFNKDWQIITVSYTVPSHASRLDVVKLVVGCPTAAGGGVEVIHPSISVSGGNVGFARLWAAALVDITASGGSVGFSSSFANVGVTNLSFDATAKELSFNLPVSNNSNNIAPIIQCQTFSANALNVEPRVISHSRDTGGTVIRLLDTITGAVVLSMPSVISITITAIGI